MEVATLVPLKKSKSKKSQSKQGKKSPPANSLALAEAPAKNLDPERNSSPSLICPPAPTNKQTEKAYRNVYVDDTPFGKGLFARRRLLAERVVGRIQGTVLSDPDYHSDYCIELTKKLTLEPAQPFCYLNHSCDPNCELVWVKPRGKKDPPYVQVETLDEIAPGEQLTIDYAWPADAAIRCGCGSDECRGWIVDESELEELL